MAADDRPRPMEEADGGLEGGRVDRAAAGPFTFTASRAPRRRQWNGTYAPSTRLPVAEYREVVALADAYGAIPRGPAGADARRTFRTTRVNTLLPDMRRGFWRLYFKRQRDAQQVSGNRRTERRVQNWARDYNGGAGVQISAESMAWLSVFSSPFINPAHMPHQRVKVPTFSTPARNSTCLCVRSYTTMQVAQTQRPLVYLSSPNPMAGTMGMPNMNSYDLEAYVGEANAPVSGFAVLNMCAPDQWAQSYNLPFFSQMDLIRNQPFRVVGHAVKVWVTLPPAANGGNITAYQCTPSAFHDALRARHSSATYDNPIDIQGFPDWIIQSQVYAEHMDWAQSMRAAIIQSNTLPAVNLRDAARGCTIRWNPPSINSLTFRGMLADPLNGGNATPVDQRLVTYTGVNAVDLAPSRVGPVPYAEPFVTQTPVVRSNNAAGQYDAGIPFAVAAAIGPAGQQVALHICRTPGNAGIPGFQPANDASVRYMLPNGATVDQMYDLAETAPGAVFDSANFDQYLAFIAEDLPVGAAVVVQSVWHYEVATDVASALNATATPQNLDAGFETVWAMSQSPVFPPVVDGHSFWDDAWQAFTDAASWLGDQVDKGTRFVSNVVSGVQQFERDHPVLTAVGELAAESFM